MKNKRVWITVSIMMVLGIVIGILGCAAPAPAPGIPTPAPAAPIVWRYGGMVPKEHWMGVSAIWWADEIGKQTNGRLKIEYYPGGTLLSDAKQGLTFTNLGTVEVADFSSSVTASEVPGVDVQALPGLIPPDMELRRKLNQTLFPDYKKLIESKYNIYLQYLVQADPRHLYTKKKIERLADLKGLKIGTSGPTEADFYNAIGAKGANINVGETYTALQQGVVDGIGYLDSAVLSFKIFEAAKYIVPIGYGGPGQMAAISKEKFDALPKDIQKIINDLVPAFLNKKHDVMVAGINAARQKLLEAGMQVVTWPKEDMDQLTGSMGYVWQKWLDTSGPNGKAFFDKTRELVKSQSK